MKYWFTDIGTVNEGLFVEITLDFAANVQLMDSPNFEKYKKLLEHEYIGGYIKFTPYTIRIPRDARWFVVVDLAGNPGQVRSSVAVLKEERKIKKKALPTL